ncbi:hypothetical protein [Actinomycetospora chiangmaiensis]|uniref:hypothetical protein n=1 Tax=Actinomycetospora chiangmaiensis TaxID=402650 RepID=UPI0003692066|nr:hypothetical protein [Actinomycetospora chiangmaiensis]
MTDQQDETRRNGAVAEDPGPAPEEERTRTVGLLETRRGGPDDGSGPGPAGAAGAEDDPAEPDDPPSGRGASALVRAAVLGLGIVLLGAAVGLAAALLSPTEYAGRATVLYIISQEQPTGFLREDRNLTTQTLLATSNAVLGPVAAQYGLTPATLAEKVSVTVPDGSELLTVEVRDPSPDTAVRVADAITKQYLQVSASAQPASDQMRYLQGQLTAAQNQIQQLRTDGSAPALAQLTAVADRAGSLSSQLDTLMLAQVAQPQAQIVVPAHADGAVGPQPVLATVTGAVSGLVVALAVGALLAWRRQRRAAGS